jgi:hypothetical protein
MPFDERLLLMTHAASVALLCSGCAAAARAPAPVRAARTECEFRTPTSCWTLTPRFPTPSPDSTPRKILRPLPTVLATGADSAGKAE